VINDIVRNPDSQLEEGTKAKIAALQNHSMALKKEIEYFKFSEEPRS
jgi:hypothetical protein